MKIKTSELEGAALDWAVAKATGMHVRVDIWAVNGLHWPYEDSLSSGYNKRVFPSSDWSQGGPLIQRYNVELFIQPTSKGRYGAGIPEVCRFASDSYLVSAMRAIVASELGDEVDVPEKLL